MAAFTVIVTGAATAVMLIPAPLTYTEVDHRVGPFEIDTIAEAIGASVLGVALVFVTPHVSNAITAVWMLFARYLLGATSR